MEKIRLCSSICKKANCKNLVLFTAMWYTGSPNAQTKEVSYCDLHGKSNFDDLVSEDSIVHDNCPYILEHSIYRKK
jgi:hypothetical protein